MWSGECLQVPWVGEGMGQLQEQGRQGCFSEVWCVLNFKAQGRIWRRGPSGKAGQVEARERVQAVIPGHQPHTPFLPCPLQAVKLKARLTLMEGWLQGSDCGGPWGPMDILQGESPRGDVYQGHHLLQGRVGGHSWRPGGEWRADWSGTCFGAPRSGLYALRTPGAALQEKLLNGEPV